MTYLFRELTSITRFVPLVLFLILFQALAWWISHGTMTQVGIANIVGTLLRFVDANVVIEYNQIWSGLTERYVVIDHQCTGFSLIATLSAILFVLPINWQKKITGVVIIIVFVQLENVVRISHLYYLVVNNSPSFDFYHLYLWQGVNFVYAIALFLITFKLLIPKEKNEII